jgi:hypothetical protein
MLELTRSISQEKLFRKQLYPWLRVWPLARWIAAQTSSHYRWARTRIRRSVNREKLNSAKPKPSAASQVPTAAFPQPDRE